MKKALVAKAVAPVKSRVLAKVRVAYTEPKHSGTGSDLSEDLQRAWDANPTLESLLARLAENDIQKAQNDPEIDRKMETLLAGKPEDLWIAHRIRKGRLGTTAGKRPLEARYVQGTTNRRALVIAGVHGSELQGIEVAEMLYLSCAGSTPEFSFILVPAVFPDNAATGTRERAGTATNRNFPRPNEDLAAASRMGRGRPVDATTSRSGTRTRGILPENQMLIQLIERYKPERIISIHGTQYPGAAGVFYDPIQPSADQMKRIRQDARTSAFLQTPAEFMDAGEGNDQLRFAEESAYKYGMGRLRQRDRDLALAAAAHIDERTSDIRGREERSMAREGGAPSGDALAARRAHPSVAGNVGASGILDLARWSGSVGQGVSLGGYASGRGIGIFTIEPPLNFTSSQYPVSQDPGVDQLARTRELEAFAEAIRKILLGSP